MIWKNENGTVMIEMGQGDVGMGLGKRAGHPYSDELVIYQNGKGEIGRPDTKSVGKSTDEINPDVRFVFHRIESLDVLIERLQALRAEMTKAPAGVS